ncbi:hypothetical protein Taro_005056 [Colocasia esculenta]|uniref:Uncharacterized protein n=1 Tax=Colocasia esculenta TaxID=4460 RepID=A0A843TNS4_COLES|nr:hypothetical protein [Colocasia esculenta]
MAAASLKLLCAFLLVCISSGGTVVVLAGKSCGPSSIPVDQHTTGQRQGFDFEFAVEVKNACGCAQRNVRVFAPGFVSQKPVKPALFRRDGTGAFVVNGGNPIPPGSTVKFTYWWDHATHFIPAGSQPLCR